LENSTAHKNMELI